MNRTLLLIAGLILIGFVAFGKSKKEEKAFVKSNIEFASTQTSAMVASMGDPAEKPVGRNYPSSANKEGKVFTLGSYSWEIGFFPGSLWYLYELTGSDSWRVNAVKWTLPLEYLKDFTGHHDLGFMVYCPFGNAERLDPKPEYKDIIVQSSKSLCTRFNEKAGVIKSWNIHRSWDGVRVCNFPVIIDNMMNLEMLCEATKMSGDPTYRDIAIKHANTTMKNHFRDDMSSYHVVNYDTTTGEATYKMTAQGYSDNSTWSRGQAWAIYGFTMMYREIGDKAYLNVATKAADYFLKNLPEDMVPYWDFNIGQEGYKPDVNSNALKYTKPDRDASAAAIVCSALFELGKLSGNKSYTQKAIQMLHSLSSPAYRAAEGSNGNFILMHTVGSIPHGGGIDAPQSYADYYYLEALTRYKNYLKID